MKKKKGSVMDLIVPLIGILVTFVAIIACSNYISATSKYIKSQQIARKYALKMEVDGYLTPANTEKFKKELTDNKFKNINISGTTVNKVKFGEDLYLKLAYDQEIKELEIKGFNFNHKENIKRVTINNSTTAKN